MNFPMSLQIFQFFYWLVNTPGLGGILLVVLVGGVVLAAGQTLCWINRGGEVDEGDTYSYPTSGLHKPD